MPIPLVHAANNAIGILIRSQALRVIFNHDLISHIARAFVARLVHLIGRHRGMADGMEPWLGVQ